MKRSLIALLALLLAAALPAVAHAQGGGAGADNNSVGDDDRLAGEESTEGATGIAYYVVVAALSVGMFVGLLYLTTQYRKDRGSRPPP